MAGKKRGRPKRAQVEVSIVCPWDKCGRRINVKIFRDIVEKAVPAKVEFVPVVEKDSQRTLFDEPPGPPKRGGKKASAIKGRASKKKKSVKGLKKKAPSKKAKPKKKGRGRKK